MTKATMTILTASRKDIPGIIAVGQENLLANRTQHGKAVLAQHGFLITLTTAPELEALVDNSKQVIALVAKEEDKIIGYTLAYQLSYWKKLHPDWHATLELPPEIEESLATTNTLYYRHIARLSDKKGTGQLLLQALLAFAKANDYQHMLCAIAHEPIPNQISQDFHKRFGFEEVGKQQSPDHLMGLYLKNIQH